MKLQEIPGEDGSDYINASFLDVSCRPEYTIIPICYYYDLFRDMKEQTIILELKVAFICKYVIKND